MVHTEEQKKILIKYKTQYRYQKDNTWYLRCGCKSYIFTTFEELTTKVQEYVSDPIGFIEKQDLSTNILN